MAASVQFPTGISCDRNSLPTNPATDLLLAEHEQEPLTRASVSTKPSTSFHQKYGSIDLHIPAVLEQYRRRVSCQRFCYNRVPKGKGFMLVFILNILESLVFFSCVSGIRQLIVEDDSESLGFFIYIGVVYCAGKVFYPIAGLLADVFFGRYKVIHMSLWLLWIAFALLAFTVSLNALTHVPVLTQYTLPIIAFILVSAGSGGVQATNIPFGVDQLSQGASSDELSSYFYWYDFGIQAGTLTGILTLLGLFYIVGDSAIDEVCIAMQFVVAVLAMTVAIILHVSFESWYFKDKQRENPLKLVVNVLYYIATVKRRAPQYRRAFRHGEPWKPRIELAKIEYDGIFASEEVEDVKTFFRVLLIIFSLAGYFVSYTGAFTMISYQVNILSMEVIQTHSYHLQYLSANLVTIFNTGTILIFCPTMNHLLLPCLPFTTMRKRLGLGILLNILAIAVTGILEWTTYSHTTVHRLLWFMLPVVLISVAELLVFVTGLEFIYAQSPESMKGLLTGLFYFVFGLFSGVAVLIFYKFPKYEKFDEINCNAILYVIFVVISLLGFVAYVIVAFLYSNRERPSGNPEEDIHSRLVRGLYS